MIYFTDKEEEKAEPLPMGAEEFFGIARRLELYHSVFGELWRLGRPVFANSYGSSNGKVKTAEIHFEIEGKALSMFINPFLWGRLNEEQRLFIICHECLHVVFNYGFRVRTLEDSGCANISADVAINQILVDNFGFERTEVDPYDELCWNDNGALKDLKAEPLESMEYYYNLIFQEMGKMSGGSGGQFILGNHGDSAVGDGDAVEDLLKKLSDTLSDDEKFALKDLIEKHFREEDNYDYTKCQQAGDSPGNVWVFVEKQPVKPKKKWETVIKKWANTQIKEERKEIEQWVMLNRRFTLLPRNLIIPSENEFDAKHEEKKRIEVWFFQDTSGSCAGYRDRFFRAAESLPKKRFDVRMHCFDTRVYETSLESRKLHGFGGTKFSPIESYILANSGTKYPKAVFVITDGWGNMVNPKHPDRWYIFLVPNGDKYCFPNECNFFDLTKFE